MIKKADWHPKRLALTGLARIATPEAVQILKSHLDANEPTLKCQIEVALWEIRTGSKVEVLH